MKPNSLFDNQFATPLQVWIMLAFVFGAFLFFAWLDHYDASVAECAEFGLEYEFMTGECRGKE